MSKSIPLVGYSGAEEVATQRIYRNLNCETDLPHQTQVKLLRLLGSGFLREVLIVTDDGDVLVDQDDIDYDATMQARAHGRPRSESMSIAYPIQFVVEE